MALDKDTLQEIKSYMDERSEAWKLEAKDSAQEAARSEVKAADERIARRNTIFGVGVGAVALSAIGFGYASITGSVANLSETAKVQAIAAATSTAEVVANAQLAEGKDLAVQMKEQISALSDGRAKMSADLTVALLVAEQDSEDARAAAAELKKLQTDYDARATEAVNALSEAETQLASLLQSKADIETFNRDLRSSLSQTGEQLAAFRKSAAELDKAKTELDTVAARLETANSLLDELLNAGDNSLANAANQMVTLALADQEITEKIIDAAAFPRGSVLAFDRSNGCPAGWKQFEPANGRFILGVGQGIIDRIGDQDELLTNRIWRESDGAETVTLSAAQMAEHVHALFSDGGSTIAGLPDSDDHLASRFAVVGAPGDAEIRPGRFSPSRGISGKTGGNQPHNNMPPYIALYFCKKD